MRAQDAWELTTKAIARDELLATSQGKAVLEASAFRLIEWAELYAVPNARILFHRGRHWGEAKKRADWHPPPIRIYSGAAGEGSRERVEVWAYDALCLEG